MSDNTSLSKLVELAKAVPVSEEQKEEQRRSFVFGNVAIERRPGEITREFIDQCADRLASS